MPAGAPVGAVLGPPIAIPDKPPGKKPENVCPFMTRGELRQDPNCRAGKDHDPETVRLAAVWREYDRQCIDFQKSTGVSVAAARAQPQFGGLPQDGGAA
eukprot:15464906-Alexandrium_andersonii.AAC.1